MSGISNVLNTKTNIVTLSNEQLKQLNAQTGKQSLSLSAGDTVSGKIVSITNSEDGSRTAVIDLGNNSSISAKLNDGMTLSNGQNVAFLVRSTASNTLTLSPLFENTAIDPTTIKALTAAGVEVNNASIYMVSKMMENGMSIDKDSITDMLNTINKFPGADIGNIVEMKNLGIEVDENNIKSYEAYKNYEHQVVDGMNSVMDELPGAFDSLVASGKMQTANDLYGDVLKTITGDGQNVQSQENVAQSENALNPENIENAAKGSQVMAEGELSSPATGEAGSEVQTILNNISDDKNATVKGQNITFDQDFINKLNDISPKAAMELQSRLNEGKNTLSENELKNLLRHVSDEYALAKEDGSKTEAFNKLFSTDDFKNMVKSQMSTQWLIRPEDVREKENIEKLYNRLNEQTKQMAHVLEKALGQDNPLTKNVQNLQKNIDFINELNQMFSYVQLPLKMANQNAHGDLYVYANKKQKRAEDGSVSAILHLDMDHLGPLDVYVKLTGNNVKTNFYVADDAVLDLIAANIETLNERLNKRGYNMEAKMMLHTDKDSDSPDPAVQEMLDIKKMPVVSFTAFDARA